MNDPVVAGTDSMESLRSLTTLVYALQALGFLVGVTFVAGVIINSIKKEDVQQTWLASHFRWQIRTFWFGALWCALGALLALVIIGYFVLMANAVWVLYRIIKGWLRLSEGKPMYTATPPLA